jgi:hypothetical protein
MPRAYRHMTWRIVDPDRAKTSSLDSELQALVPNPEHITSYSWVTVARGNGYDLAEIAKALNRARFTLGDIRPVKSSTEKRR